MPELCGRTPICSLTLKGSSLTSNPETKALPALGPAKDLENRISADVLARSHKEREAINELKQKHRVEEDEVDSSVEIVYVKD